MTTKSLLQKSKKGGEVDRVYRLIRHWILTCRFRPGEFLPEVEVATQCNASRTPIREACNRLAEEKWLLKIRNKGYIVSPISVQDIMEIYQYRKILECFTAGRAAEVIKEEDLASLRKVTEVEEQPNAKVKDVVAANYVLHRQIGKVAQNQRVYDQLIITLDYVQRLDILSTRHDSGGWILHRDIMAALEAHDVKSASSAMAEHIDSSRDRMLRLFS